MQQQLERSVIYFPEADVAAAPAPVIALVDVRHRMREERSSFLKLQGMEVLALSTAEGLVSRLRQRPIALLIVTFPSGDDVRREIESLGALRMADPLLPIIVIIDGESGSIEREILDSTASEILTSPNPHHLLSVVALQLELRGLRARQRQLEATNRDLRIHDPLSQAVLSPSMKHLLELIPDLRRTDADVLITGEHGVEKLLLAQAIHDSSRRASRLFVAPRLGGKPELWLEGELFGRTVPFTGESSHRPGSLDLALDGTVYLDDVASLPINLQAKLLQFLEADDSMTDSSVKREPRARILSGSSARFEDEMGVGRFDRSLHDRLATIVVRVPPLRERPEDIPWLSGILVRRYGERYRRPARGFDDDAMTALVEYSWPGNVRELEGVIERAVLLSDKSRLTVQDIGMRNVDEPASIENLSLEELEYLLVKKTMKRFNGNVSRASEALGLTRSAMYRRLHRFGL